VFVGLADMASTLDAAFTLADNRYLRLAQFSRLGLLVGMFGTIAALVASLTVLYLSRRPFVVYHEVTDPQGHLISAERVQPAVLTDVTALDKWIAVREFITDLRWWSPDTAIRESFTRSLMAHSTEPIGKQVKAYLLAQKAADGQVSVEIESTVENGPGVYAVRWTERRVRSTDVEVTKWWATIAVKLYPPQSDAQLLNPLGIYITELAISPDQG
jgi:type IV secretory pathway TrbF-like protein